jgi:hypothetical protein
MKGRMISVITTMLLLASAPFQTAAAPPANINGAFQRYVYVQPTGGLDLWATGRLHNTSINFSARMWCGSRGWAGIVPKGSLFVALNLSSAYLDVTVPCGDGFLTFTYTFLARSPIDPTNLCRWADTTPPSSGALICLGAPL